VKDAVENAANAPDNCIVAVVAAMS
jgi:hypothetical protein